MPEQTERTKQTEVRTLSCKLTRNEFAERATELAKTERELVALEADRKAANDAFKNRAGGLNDRRAVLCEAVITRAEPRLVDCTWHADWVGKSMLLRRDDTGEVVHVRTMTPEEVQERFDFTADNRQLPDKTDDSDPLDA